MDNGITIKDVENYVNVVIPNIESKLGDESVGASEKAELYGLYVTLLRMVAPYDFISFNKYLELDEDKTQINRGFYHHRKDHLGELFHALNDMEIYDKYDILLVSLPPRTGKTTTGIRFLSWICGRHYLNTQLAISYADNVTSSFYIGVIEIVESQRYNEVFPLAKLVNQNAKKEQIWLGEMKRYPSINFIPIGGSMTGIGEANNYLYLDDLVSGIEEAMSIPRLEKLWDLYTTNCRQRRKEGCKEIHVATRWSVHDPISKVDMNNQDNPRCKVISIPCYNEQGESNFNFNGGFSTDFYKDIQRSMDSINFSALYMCQPIEREGILYNSDELQYYFDLPSEKPDTIIAICDSKNMGKDYVASPIGYVYGDTVFIEDVVFNNGLPEITRPLVAGKWLEHKVVRADVELNNGGNYYAEDLNNLLRDKGGKTSVRIFYSGNNKTVKIITYSDFVKKNFVFKHPSKYSPTSEYGQFMKSLLSWTQKGNNKYDDAPDSIAMLAQLFQDLQGKTIKILDRRTLGL